MHDPEILVLSVPHPIKWLCNKIWKKDSYVESVLDIWHVDPERNGTDDSCGYSYPVICKEEKSKIREMGESEYKFMFGESYATLKGASTYEIIWATWRIIAWRQYRRSKLTLDEITYISDLAGSPHDNLQNWVTAAKSDAKACGAFFEIVNRSYRRCNRRWWQHPRFHLFHWGYLQINREYEYDSTWRDTYFKLGITRNFMDNEILQIPKKELIGAKLRLRISNRARVVDENDQPYAVTLFSIPWPICFMRFNVPLLQRVRRVLFTRCCKCGKGVAWKNWSNMVTDQWNRSERWYHIGEKHLYHANCSDLTDSGVRSS